MDLEDLYGRLSGLSLRNEVENVLRDTDMFLTTGDRNKVVVAKTKLRLCKVRECHGCSNLHLCKMYLFGECPYQRGRQGCHFCHDLASEHNISVLSQHNLLELDRTELCSILLQNDNTLLPPVCFTYNKGSGEYGNCSDKETCRRLHICKNYIRGTCNGSTECSRSHDFFEPHPLKNLQAKGVPGQLMGSMLPAYNNMLAIWDANGHKVSTTLTSATETSEICLFHIRNYCKWGNKCQRMHFHLPYKWEMRDGLSWRILPDNEEIERAFCDPANTYSDVGVPVYFDTMTQGFAEVRRLSTVSSVLNPNFILTTTWIWYWEDGNGKWMQYGSSEGTNHKPSITSEDLERKYQENNNAVIEFTAGQHSYELNMHDMMEYNRQMGTKRSVRRRPVFLSAENIQKIKASQKKSRSLSLPYHWDKTNMSESGFKRVLLNSTTDEYKKIVELFHQTMSGFNVKSIERVQNQDLWEVYQWQDDVMRKKTASKENEKLLFHGTEFKHIDTICQQNLDWRICGVHGTAYGKGSYFARDAKYSHSYTDKSGNRCMFACRVLVGEYTTGQPNYLRPPSKDGEDIIFYDSCVNDINNPSIFVVFEKHQVYPEYLIQYEGETETSSEKILTNEFSQICLASLDDLSEPRQLSSHSSFSSLTSEENVQLGDPVPSSVTVTGPQKKIIIRHRATFRPMFICSRAKSFKSIAPQSTRTRISKPASVKKYINRKTVRPQTHQRCLRGVSSVVPPRSISVNDTMSVSSQNDTPESYAGSTLGLSSDTSADLSIDTKTNSVRNQKARQQRSRFTRLAKSSQVTMSLTMSTDTKISNFNKNQNASRQTSNLKMSAKGLSTITLSAKLLTDAKYSNPGRNRNARQRRTNLTSKGSVPVTLPAGLSSDSNTSKPDGSQNAKQKMSSVPRSTVGSTSLVSSTNVSTRDDKTLKQGRSQNAKQDLSNAPRLAGASCTNLSNDTKISRSVSRNASQQKSNGHRSSVVSSPVVSPTNMSREHKTLKPVRGQNAKQESAGVPRSAGASSLVVSSTTLSNDTKTSKSVRSPNANQQRSYAPRPPGGSNPVVSSANSSTNNKTQSARQQTSGSTRSPGGLNSSLSTQSPSKSVRNDSAKTQRAPNPAPRSKTSAASQKSKTTGKGHTARR